ncbi:FtsP/CotA-like multicopper oxidase with cupredoxin domain [Planifilum fimeticola]|uniref:FtsP/CotA-like multicopper oxidase with cupredoxin domain n=1 Tax=Planifilum fimeticola TaxID=201975 RepID=A0A2T0LJJ6_9BACL|nr:multicopper oxidase family protein [Planifilum fimeticola]PRX42688.1 FtsP/CotA-like multicopper oxidase with cupredoxin domain [Planifilum fimeticola]
MMDVYLFSSIWGFIFLLLPTMVLMWGLAANRIGRLPFRSSREKLKKSARRSLVLLWLALVTSLLFVGLAALVLVRFGWVFVQEWAVFALPALLLTHLAVILFTMPRLRSLTRDRQGTGPVDGEVRGAIAAPPMAVPVQTAFAAAGLSSVQLCFYPVLTLFPIRLTLFWAAFLGLGALLWFRQRRRERMLRREEKSPSAGFRLMRVAATFACIAAVGVILFVLSMQASILPDRMSMMNHSRIDYGGGPAVGHGGDGSHHAHAGHGKKAVNVTELTGPRTGEPDRRYTLVARKETVRLSSGKTVEAWTFNGQVPGPELRARKGELVEVTLINEDIDDGVTIHWHGVDVPNAEDGVAGLTQDAVKPGERHTYRFRVEETGTHWYHSHQTSSIQVKKGLFGPLVLLPEEEEPEKGLDLSLMYHFFGNREVLNDSDTLRHRRVDPGTEVRLRLTNTDSYPRFFTLVGTPFRVTAIDGNEIHRPGELENVLLSVAAGGRYDVIFTMPDRPVRLTAGTGSDDPEILFTPDGKGKVPEVSDHLRLSLFDPADYGEPGEVPLGLSGGFDREFTMVFDFGMGFYNGMFRDLWLINGEKFPHTPTFMVQQGDLVKTTFINRSPMDHPMHLHGHHMLVLSKNGKPVTGSPWWTDTLNVAPGESYEVAFRADNPGIWMDHCHNLDHAAAGMTLHLSYEGVTTPFHVGGAAGNHPE